MNKIMKNILKAFYAPVLLVLLLVVFSKIRMKDSDLWACAVFLSGMIVLYFLNRIPINEKRSAVLHGKQIILSVCIGFAYTAALTLLIETLPVSWKWQQAAELPASTIMNGVSLPYIITLFGILPIAEELSFRHLLLGELCESLPQPAAVLISTVCYGFLFLIRDGVYGMLFGMITGLLLSLIYLFSFSMWSAVAAHVACTLGLLMSYLSAVFPKAWIIALSLGMLAAAFFLLLHMEHLDEEEE